MVVYLSPEGGMARVPRVALLHLLCWNKYGKFIYDDSLMSNLFFSCIIFQRQNNLLLVPLRPLTATRMTTLRSSQNFSITLTNEQLPRTSSP